ISNFKISWKNNASSCIQMAKDLVRSFSNLYSLFSFVYVLKTLRCEFIILYFVVNSVRWSSTHNTNTLQCSLHALIDFLIFRRCYLFPFTSNSFKQLPKPFSRHLLVGWRKYALFIAGYIQYLDSIVYNKR